MSRYASAKLLVVVTFVALIALWSAPAHAQSFGLRAGASASPDQFYFGVHADTPPIADRLSFRPNVELGLGNDVTLAAVNLELVYRLPLQNSMEWVMLAGAGPSANFYSFSGMRDRSDNELGGGLNLLLGLEHRNGFFGEVKVGLIDSPSVKFGVGFTFGR
ncbi:MAG: hypothetical protein IT185_02155 [Acidobacteria bacterium]|nr:hypothetical protein [Acidobacteriota bacterium]